MKIEHIAIFTTRLDEMAAFYARYFGATEGTHYHNPKTGLRTRFLSFEDGCRLELMSRPDHTAPPPEGASGYAHLAFDAGSHMAVDALSARLAEDGYTLQSGPRTTGDGYYESVVLDPEGNQVEITG